MIDALYKQRIDGWWDRLGVRVARAGVSADAVTWLALGLGALNALAFLQHGSRVAFGLGVAAVGLLDDLDGAVARASRRQTRAGSFLDAWADRYQELFALLAVAVATGHWPACFLAVTGSLLVSYTQARAAMEGAGGGPAPAGGLPDLFERFERVALLCLGLVLSPFLPADLALGRDLLFWSLCLLALMTHVTALQRFRRGLARLRAGGS